MPTQPGVLPLPELVPEQEHLVGYIPTVMGPVEFREWKQQLERIDEILEAGGVEEGRCGETTVPESECR